GFIELINQDAALRDQINAAATEGTEAMLQVAQSAGFTFTVEEFQLTISQLLQGADSPLELSEIDLDAVVGGISSFSLNFDPPAPILPAVQNLGNLGLNTHNY